MVIFSKTAKQVIVVELAVSWEEQIDEAQECIRAKAGSPAISLRRCNQ